MSAFSFLGINNCLKILVAGAAICGLIVIPFTAPVLTAAGGGEEIEIQEDTKTPVSPIQPIQKKSEPEIVKKPSGPRITLRKGAVGEADLSFDFSGFFDGIEKGGKKIKKFSEVNMKFGDYVLKPNDLLVNPAQDGVFYLAKNSRNGYLSHDGTKVNIYREADFLGKNYPNIRLKWFDRWGQVDNMISRIEVGTCTFTAIATSKAEKINKRLQIVCYPYINTRIVQPYVYTVLNEQDLQKLLTDEK